MLAAGQLRRRKIYANSQENISNSWNRKEIQAASESQSYCSATPHSITRVPPATTLFNRPFNRLSKIQLSSLQQTGKRGIMEWFCEWNNCWEPKVKQHREVSHWQKSGCSTQAENWEISGPEQLNSYSGLAWMNKLINISGKGGDMCCHRSHFRVLAQMLNIF